MWAAEGPAIATEACSHPVGVSELNTLFTFHSVCFDIEHMVGCKGPAIVMEACSALLMHTNFDKKSYQLDQMQWLDFEQCIDLENNKLMTEQVVHCSFRVFWCRTLMGCKGPDIVTEACSALLVHKF